MADTSNSSVVTAVHLPATTKAARDQLYSYIHNIIEYSRTNELGTVKYALCVPDGANAETTLYIFEEYVDKAAWSTHMSAQPVKDFLNLLEQDKSLLGPDMFIKHLSWIPDAILSRTSRLPSATPGNTTGQVLNPYVLWATITDPQTADIATLEPYGAAVVKYAQQNEQDTLFYADAIMQDLAADDTAASTQGGFIAAVEVYANKQACLAHLQDPQVQALAQESGRLKSNLAFETMNMVEGWLTR